MGQVTVTRPAEGVAAIRIEAPPVNKLGAAIRERLLAELLGLEDDLSVRAIVLTGQGQAFCAGDDLAEAVTRGETAVDSLKQFGRIIETVETGRVPVIAAINGHAVGGGMELALGCDIRIGSTDAKFIAAGVNVGLMASVYRLPRLIGLARAKEILLTGLPCSAQTALQYGLITELHAPEALMDAAFALAERIASRAPLSVEATKRQSARAYELSPDEALGAAIQELSTLSRSRDHFTAVEAFRRRETPAFVRA
jgi:enoyl-CoA hydratase